MPGRLEQVISPLDVTINNEMPLTKDTISAAHRILDEAMTQQDCGVGHTYARLLYYNAGRCSSCKLILYK
jgi:hypothetical protein